MQSEKINLIDFFVGKSKVGTINRIVIPDIQRDYVMGSGGEKLTSLLDQLNRAKEKFDFSCIMGYKDESNNTFYVYDGQQRLVTLIYLAAYLISKDNGIDYDVYIKELKKFTFTNRNSANEYLKHLLNNGKKEIVVDDYTTFSIENLIKSFEEGVLKDSNKTNLISVDYLLNNVCFELLPVQKVGDAEQFFMDLNDGLNLKNYEIFKAELFHLAQYLLGNKSKEFALSVDNKWLNFFLSYKTDEYCEEEIEIAFIKFCFRMMWIEENETDDGYIASNLEWLETNHLERLRDIMDNVTNLKIDNINSLSCVNYSFGNRIDREQNKKVNNVEGVYWNLADDSYPTMLNIFLKNFYIEGNENSVNKDAIIWEYISNCEKSENMLFQYLRFVKKLLNHNLIENNNAYYDNNRRLWHTKYGAYGIPTYYRSKIDDGCPFGLEYREKTNYIYSIICLNQKLKNEFCIERFSTNNEMLKGVLENEKNNIDLYSVEQINELENLPYINGILNTCLNKDISLKKNELEQFIIKDLNDYYLDSRKKLFEIYYTFSDKIKKNILYKVNVQWPTYYNYKSYKQEYSLMNSCNILPQTLTDFFIDINNNQSAINKREDEGWSFFVKFYNCISNSWRQEEYDYCFPDMDDNNRNFLSSKSVIYCNPIKKINILDDFLKSIHIIYLNDSSNIEIKLNTNIVPKHEMPWEINSQIGWLENLLVQKKYSSINYSIDCTHTRIILTEYCRNNANALEYIKDWSKNNKHVVLTVLNKAWFISCRQISNFIELLGI